MQNLKDSIQGTAGRVRERVSETAAKASEMGRSAGAHIDEARTGFAEALHSTASSVRRGSQKTTDAIDDCAMGTAEGLDTTSTYVREHDLQGMLSDGWKTVRRNPGPAIVLALAAGFFAGAALRRR